MVDSWQSAVCGAFAGAKDYIILGKTKEGGEKCENINYAETTFLRNSRLFRRRAFHWLRKERLGAGGTLLKRCLLERQPICF